MSLGILSNEIFTEIMSTFLRDRSEIDANAIPCQLRGVGRK